MLLSHTLYGTGSEKVIVIHDWFSDCSGYFSLKPYLDTKTYTFCFVDLRGYGGSKEISGEYNLEEIHNDLSDVLHHLGWKDFHFIGHSMTGLYAKYLAVHPLSSGAKVQKIVAIAPVAAKGSEPDDETRGFMLSAAKDNDEAAGGIVTMLTGERYDTGFIQEKVQRWRDCSTPEARAGYYHMFTDVDFHKDLQGKTLDHLTIITGDHDFEGSNAATMKDTIGRWAKGVKFENIPYSGHYPMEECPPTLAALLHAGLR